MARRDEWAKRIEQWKEGGLTGAQFAHEIGVKEGTLRHWKWQLNKLARTQEAAPARLRRAKFVELIAPSSRTSAPPGVITAPEPFELVLSSGLRIRVCARFNADALHRLLDVLEDR